MSVVGEEIWNCTERCEFRLSEITRFLEAERDQPLVIPEIGLIYSDLDLELLGRDLGWGGSRTHSLRLSVADLTVKGVKGSSILELIEQIVGPENFKIADYKYSISGYVRKSKSIYPKGIFDEVFSEGDFSMTLGDDGSLKAFVVFRSPPKVEETSPGKAAITVNMSQYLDLLDPDRGMQSVRKTAVDTVDEVFRLLAQDRSQDRGNSR